MIKVQAPDKMGPEWMTGPQLVEHAVESRGTDGTITEVLIRIIGALVERLPPGEQLEACGIYDLVQVK